MSFQKFTAILASAKFPFTVEHFERPILIPGMDLPARAPRSFAGEPDSKNFELPIPFYAQNVLPTTGGIQSTSYQQLVAGIPGNVDFDQVILLRDASENNFLLAPANGQNYIYTASTNQWNPTNSFVGFPGGTVSRSYVNGRTFVCYANWNIYEYNSGAGTFLPVAISGVPVANIDGISNSSNYLLYWSGITVGWSSLIDPTDLNPSFITGAGQQIPQDVKGKIRCIAPITGGFIIYTTKNAVAALFTNNARSPFIFREISGAGGVIDPRHVTIDAALSYHYAWTTNGLQKISINASEMISDDASDFLAGKLFETFDIPSLTLTLQRISTNFNIKVTFVSGRFLVVSYGLPSSTVGFTHALVYDAIQKRWGKLRVDHTDCFQYPYPNLPGQVTFPLPLASLAFLQQDGTIQLCIQDDRVNADQGVVIVGRFQAVREKVIGFDGVEVESTLQAYPPDVYLMVSPDGKALGTPSKLQQLVNSGNFIKFGAPQPSSTGVPALRTGKSFALLVTGTFEFNTMVFSILPKMGNR